MTKIIHIDRQSLGRVYGNAATVYHRTRQSEILANIEKHGFKAHPGLYGPGLYATYEFESQQRPDMLKYGEILIKAKVSLEKSLILDPALISRFNMPSIPEQLSGLDVDAGDLVNSELALKLFKNVKGLHRKVNSVIFHGSSDGDVIVVYNTEMLVPMSWCYSGPDYLSKSEKDLHWTSLKSYSHLQRSVRACIESGFAVRNRVHERTDPDWDGSYVWHGGEWRGGTWKTGVWLDGLWMRGTWNTGVWHDGDWYRGDWRNGVWMGGTWHDGIWHQGTWHGGTWVNGVWKSGIWEGGFDRWGGFQKDPPNTWSNFEWLGSL